VQSKRNAQLARAQERDLLFSSKSEGIDGEGRLRRRNPDKPRGSQDEAVAASGDVTAALRRTHQLLQTEVQRSHFAQEIFNESSEAIKQLSVSYNDLDTLLSSSKTLLSTLVTSQKSDTWYLETTLYVLLATIGWLVFRRLLYGPLWWFAWLPLKLAYRMIFVIFGIVGIGGKAQASTSLSAPSSSLSTSIAVSSATVIAPRVKMTDHTSDTKDQQVKGEDKHPASEEIAKMVENSKSASEEEKGEKEEVRRGDGTKLISSDAPRNPKKRMFEAKPDNAEDKEKDEL
jgi:protein transport protein SEC20